jgi:hypothetical protein
MASFLLNTLISAFLIAGAAELAKRQPWMGAILISLPLSSIIFLTSVYLSTRSDKMVIELSYKVFWAVLPSLSFFLILPLLMKGGLHFGFSLLFSCAMMVAGYAVYAKIFLDRAS